MSWLMEFITERPVLFVRYVCYITIAIVAMVSIIKKKKISKGVAAMDSDSVHIVDSGKTFSVNVFLGEDKYIRFVPGVKNRFGIYVPIPEGIEVSFDSNEAEIGKGFIAAAQNALNHYGEDLDMRTAPAKYKSFKKFTSQKKFNLSHCLASGIAQNGEIKFTYLVWHSGEFCLRTGDPVIEKVIPQNSLKTVIGHTIMEIFEEASNIFPDNGILNFVKQLNILQGD